MSLGVRALIVTIVVGGFGQLASAGLLVNADFETPAIASGTHLLITPATPGFGWTVSGTVDVVDASSLFFGINWFDTSEHAIDGDQILDLNGDNAGSVFQDFATVVGEMYSLSFWFSNNPAVRPTESSPESALVSLTDVGTSSTIHSDGIVHSSATLDDPFWELYKVSFVAQGATTRLAFASTSNPTSSTGGVFIDSVNVSTATPEPASLAMWAALGAIFPMAAWRRKRREFGRHGG